MHVPLTLSALTDIPARLFVRSLEVFCLMPRITERMSAFLYELYTLTWDRKSSNRQIWLPPAPPEVNHVLLEFLRCP